MRNRLPETGIHILKIAKRMKEGRKDISKCPGVTGFTDNDWARLDELVKRAVRVAKEGN